MAALPRLTLRLLTVGTLALGLNLMATPAMADAPSTEEAESDTAKAQVRFKRGQELYAERNFAAALIEFRKAYEIAPNHRVLFNIGQVCYQMQDYVCAHKSLEQYLTEGGTDVPAERRTTVSNELGLLKQRIGFLNVRANVEGAEVLVDDVVVGTAPTATPVAVSAGRHRIVVAAPGRTPVTRSIDVAGQDTATVEVTFAEPVIQQVQVAQPEAQAPRWTSKMTTLSWIGYGAGAAVLVGGGIVGGFALAAAKDGGDTNYATKDAAENNRDRANTLAGASDILLSSGVVAVAVTTVATFILPRSSRVRATAVPGVFSF